MIYKFKTGGILKLQSGKKIYKHNDYYGYINKIQAQATANPEWFWSDSADASEARQWLYDNGASAVVDEIYRNTPAEIQKTISSKKLSRNVSDQRGTQQLVSDIHSAQKNFMDTAGAIGLQSAGTVALGTGLVLAPEVTIPSLVGGLAGGYSTDKIVQKVSDGKYSTFGSFVRQNNDWGQTGNLLAEFANPGFYIGGGAAAKIVGRTTPMVIKSMQNSLWKTATATGNLRYPEFTAKIRLNASEPVKWKWAKEGAYDDGVISAPLFARKSQVAHELGHHAGGQGDMILGAYTPEYSYGTGASWERQRAENFADWFRTKLGYPYKGRDLGMLARQQAIDSNPTKILTNITNARRYGETAKLGQIVNLDQFGRINPKLTIRERLGLSKGKYGSLNRFQKEALDDLEYFNNTDNYRFYWDGEKFIYSNKSNLQPGVRKLLEFDPTPKYYNFDTPFGNLKVEPSENPSIFRPKYFGTSALPSTSFGEADLYGHNRYGKIILTSPYTDAKVAGLENADSFEKTLSKDTMKRFWANADQIVPKGTYVSGDEGALPLGDQLKRDWDAMHSYGTKWFNDGTTQKVRSGSVDDLLEHLFRKYPYKTGREGLSVDSYMAILKQGNRPGHALRFSPDGFSIFNGQGVENKWLYDLHQQMLEGKIPQQQFVDAFNKWVEPYNGMKAVIKNGEVIIPHPFIRYKQGGNI